MIRKLPCTAMLAATVAVGLLAAPALAQAPITCTTTQINPARNDCVMPTASTPGGGSFPSSFLVPGTNTSFAATLAGIEKVHLTSEVNVIYLPVPQSDFILEWRHYYRKTEPGANGTANQLDAQFKFYFRGSRFIATR